MTDPRDLAQRIDADLRECSVPGLAEQERAYLKSELEHYGVPVPMVRSVVKRTLRGAGMDRAGVTALAVELWAVPVHERRTAAAEVLVASTGLLGSDDVPLLERLIRESRTWALVDVLAGSALGPLLERDPSLGGTLDRWAADPDFWIRRSVLLAHLEALRAGGGDFDRFGRYADGMLEEREFFIRKAIGWVLRDTSRRRPELVFDWILPRASRASGLTVREAVKRLSAEQREAVLAAR
ncbi:DNA alkylation repair protein [Leucobacter sp. OLJS4]|uniref:DNA alkylation repair protein n=1 Tax=Leucobacter sp. OLJS4 TaxID=1914922 RepID=UPI000C18AFD2|nr:DNA alkylation repair protein [Leucobacter sp. OLJS4]PIJ10419.1 DNA alkylation repair protein [Leucobacter sp. OLJS4]